jgi:hypothetical protein
MSTQVCTGLFTNVASTPFFIPLSQQVNEFRLKNLTQSNVTVGSVSGAISSNRIVEAFFNPNYMLAGTAQIIQNGTKTGSGAAQLAPMQNGYCSINGITVINGPIAQGATVAISSFTPGSTTVWTTGTVHGFQVGDTVRVWGLTSAPQFSGLAMTVTAVGSTTQFTTLLNSTGATTSVGSVAKTGNYLLPTKQGVYPENRVIAALTNANPMVITTLVQQNYAVGDVVTFYIPSVFGVPQLSNAYSGLPVQGTVVAANNTVGTQTVSININSTSFGVFGGTNGWVGSSNYPFSFPTMVPQGEGNNNSLQAYGVSPSPLPYANQDVLSFAKQGNGSNGVLIGAGDGTNSVTTGGIIGSTVDVWEWRAITSLQTFP